MLKYMKYQELLAKNIKNLCLKNNLTQGGFVEKIGLSLYDCFLFKF